jgi:magnesium-transporting ATPase (P-type)
MSIVAGSLGVHGKFVRNMDENIERSIADTEDHDQADFSFDMNEMNQVASPELKTLFNEAICINSTAFEDKIDGEDQFVGSKTETALLRFAKELGWENYKKVRESAEIVQMIPFSSELKAMGVVKTTTAASTACTSRALPRFLPRTAPATLSFLHHCPWYRDCRVQRRDKEQHCQDHHLLRRPDPPYPRRWLPRVRVVAPQGHAEALAPTSSLHLLSAT